MTPGTEGSNYAFRKLGAADAESLSVLLAGYAAEMGNRGLRDGAWTSSLLSEGMTAAFGIEHQARLIGFAVVFDLPESVFQTRCGQLDDLYVEPGHRGRGLAGRLISMICEEGRRRGWSHVRWLVPEDDASAVKLYRKVATEAPWKSFVIRLDPARSL